MRRFLFFVFFLLSIPVFSQDMLKKGESYFSINGDSLRNIELFNFHVASWNALYEGKIPAYLALPIDGEGPMDLKTTKDNMNYERVALLMGEVDFNYGALMDPHMISYIRTLSLNDELWVSPMFLYGEQKMPVVYFKMSDAETLLDKSLCEYARQTFTGKKTTWSSNENHAALVYQPYAYSIASVMDSIYNDIMQGKLKAFDYTSGNLLDVNQVSNCLKESVYVMDPVTFEEFDSITTVPFAGKFYGVQFHPRLEIDDKGTLKKNPSEFISVLTKSNVWTGNDYIPMQAYSLKVSDFEQNLNATEKKIWDEFMTGKPSSLACIPSSSDNIKFKDQDQKKVFVDIFKKITEDGLAGKVSVIDSWERVSPLAQEDLKSIINRKETLFAIDELGNEMETQIEVPLNVDSLLGIRIERYWRPTAKPGEFEVYKWLAAPQYPVSLQNGDLILPYMPYYIDITEMVKVYGKMMDPLQTAFDEDSKYESDLFEYVSEGDGNYFFKRLKNGESISMMNAEPSVKPGEQYYFTYIYHDAGEPSEYRIAYALRRSKVEGK